MNKRAINVQLEKAKKLIFDAEVILDNLRDEDIGERNKDKITSLLQNETRDAMDKITDMFIADVRKRKIKPRSPNYFSR